MDKFKAKSSYSIKGEENIKKEIMERGTITVAFVVYSDFELYKVGIYQHVKGRRKLHETATLETFYHFFVFGIYFSVKSSFICLSYSHCLSFFLSFSLSLSLHLSFSSALSALYCRRATGRPCSKDDWLGC